METEPVAEVSELLEYDEDTAGGMMNTEYVVLPEDGDACGRDGGAAAARRSAGNLHTFCFWRTRTDQLTGAVPLARLFLARRRDAAEGAGDGER